MSIKKKKMIKEDVMIEQNISYNIPPNSSSEIEIIHSSDVYVSNYR